MAVEQNKFAIQTQSGTPPDFGQLDWTRMAAFMFYGNALNEGLVSDVLRWNKHILLIGRAPAWDWYVNPDDPDGSKFWIQDFARETVRLLLPFAQKGLLHAVASPNEPVISTVQGAVLLNEMQKIFTAYIKAHLFFQDGTPMHVVGFSFSVGNPREDLIPYLRESAAGVDYIGLHCYGYSYPDYRFATESAFYSYRYELFMQILGVRKAVLITETGFDTRDGGFKSPRATDAGITIDMLFDDLKAAMQHSQNQDYLKIWCLFGAGMEGNLIKWKSFDVLDSGSLDEPQSDRAKFFKFVAGLPPVTARITPLVDGGVIIPPPEGEPMANRKEIAWKSIGVDYNPEAAFYRKALQFNLGKPEGNEVDYIDAQNQNRRLQGYLRGYVDTQEGQWSLDKIKVYDWLTDNEITQPIGIPDPTPTPSPIPNPARLTVIPPLVTDEGDVINLGFTIKPYVPQPGELFYGLVAAGGFKLGQGTQFLVQVVSAVPYGIPVTHAWDPLRQKSETFLTNGRGETTFVLGPGSDFTPGEKPPPDWIYVSAGAASGTWPVAKSDVINCGQVGGHTEGVFTFQLMRG